MTFYFFVFLPTDRPSCSQDLARGTATPGTAPAVRPNEPAESFQSRTGRSRAAVFVSSRQEPWENVSEKRLNLAKPLLRGGPQ